MELKTKLDELKNLILMGDERGGNLSPIERDLALQKTREIYELLLQMSVHKPLSINQPVAAAPVETVSPAIVEEEIQLSETDTSEIDSADILLVNSPDVKLDTPKVTPAPKPKSEPDLFSSPSAAQSAAKSQKSRPPKEAIGDMFSETIEKETVAEKIKKEKINRISVAIGINDKFYFINELFNGNLNEYASAIDALDTSESLNDAETILNNLAKKFNWNNKSDAYQQLLGFVERKFS